jgi:MFS transporter, OPA family, glycerol-3-phosphate transporter
MSLTAAHEGDLVTHPPGFRARRRVNWIFLGLMYGFFYMSRYNLAAIVKVSLAPLFGWNNTQYGTILAAGKVTYAAAVLLNGPLADRIGGKRAILIGCVGAAVFNFLFGACFIFLSHAAVMKDGKVIEPALLAHGMTGSTMIATFAVLWACNHYFQSFGALSIVKINAAWFHVRERGVFAGIFGIMIQGGRWMAFAISPFILARLPWQYCFWIPAGILAVMFFANRAWVEDSPEKAGYDFHTADETKEEEAQKTTLAYVLRKVFASRVTWLIAVSSMCIGMVRNGVDDWWAGYMTTQFKLDAEHLRAYLPYQIASAGMPIAAILGGLAAGTVSDRVFGSRRAPVIFFGFVGMIASLGALRFGLRSATLGCAALVAISFFIQSAHSMVGGAASMDFGGKKAVATAAGLFDGAQYLAGAIMAMMLGALVDRFRDAPGGEYVVWPLVPLPFAVLGAILISTLWNTRPGARRAH